MEIPAFVANNLKWLAIIAVILVAILLMLILNPFQVRTINAYFEPSGAVRPGQNTTLVVEVTNTLGRDIATETVSVTAIDKASLGIKDGQATQYNVAKGDLRKFRIPVVATAATEGTYSIEITAMLDSKQEITRIALEVRKG